jgi:hypothetical protein
MNTSFTSERKVVRPPRLERGTLCLEGRCSIQLSYGRFVEEQMRYVPSGKYYARIRVSGKLVVKSLKTTRITVAKLRLSDLEKEEPKGGTPDRGGRWETQFRSGFGDLSTTA